MGVFLFLTIDQGTTSSRSLLFDEKFNIIDVFQKKFKQIYLNESWVEHNPEEILETVVSCCEGVLKGKYSEKILSVGITNQRETIVVWDKKTGKPFYNAIVWQDKRTIKLCENLKKDGLEKTINKKTGLLLDPYFSASKIAWILDNIDGLRKKAENGEVCVGTIDTWLIWKLTKGKTFATDVTNASRTSLFNIKEMQWDNDLLKIFNIPPNCLPEVKACDDYYGDTEILSKSIKITGVIGDQQSSAIGQYCFKEGELKSTYGTGCFVLANTGEKIVFSDKNLLTTIACKINNKVSYALEGSIFMAGGLMNWMQSSLQVFENISETSKIASSVNPASAVIIIPAFSGLGAPYWSSNSKAAIYGLTQDTGRSELIHASLQAISLQTYDLLEAFKEDFENNNISLSNSLSIDGGMIENDWFVKNLADITEFDICRAYTKESTALGASLVSAIGIGYFKGFDNIKTLMNKNNKLKSTIDKNLRERIIENWHKAVQKTIEMAD
jgi:glycerol kinase